LVVQAFIGEHPDPLIRFMEECNERRRHLQEGIIAQAQAQAVQYKDCPILFLGGDWHPGVVGIAASKLAEEFWRPVWLFQRQELRCKGSARSIPGFDVTGAMQVAHAHFVAFGGHKAAAGFTFETSQEELIRRALIEHAQQIKETADHLWQSALRFDCLLPLELAHLELAQMLDELKPFGCAFEEPKFCIEADIAHAQYYNDKSSGQPKHTAVSLSGVPYAKGAASKVLFFNAVYPSLLEAKRARFVVTASRSTFKGQTSLSLFGSDFAVLS
jgi:single-stranded-DNA-specific exonuclease